MCCIGCNYSEYSFMDLNINWLCSNSTELKTISFFLPDLFFSHSQKSLPLELQYILAINQNMNKKNGIIFSKDAGQCTLFT